jgi:protein-tyrosine phosphatase
MEKKKSILMVCLGNICRSPMADGLLRKKVKDNALDVFVDSAGTGDYHVGEAPDKRMRETASAKKYPIDELRARQFTKADFQEFDRIYVMDKSNRDNVLRLAQSTEDRQKVKLILDELYPGEGREVPDPYFGGQQGFEDVFQMLDLATDKIIEQLK